MSKDPQLAVPITKAFNTYRVWHLAGPIVNLANPPGAIAYDTVDMPITEEAYVYAMGIWIGIGQKTIIELDARICLVPGDLDSEVILHTLHRHGHNIIPLGTDTFSTRPYMDNVRHELPFQAWIHLEKGDSVQLLYGGVFLENGAVPAEVQVSGRLYSLVKG